MKKYTIQHGALEFTARTKREATEKRDKWMEAYFANGSPRPILVLIEEGTGYLVFNTGYGWDYQLIMNGKAGCQGSGGETSDLAQSRARYHLAQNMFDPYDESTIPRTLSFLESSVIDANVRKEFESWLHWQIRYAEAAKKGDSEQACRRYADDL